MKTIKLLIAIAIALLVICLAGVITLNLIPDVTTQSTTTREEIPVDNPEVDSVTLPLTPDAGEEYIDKIYFVGDSTTYHFFKGGVDKSHLLVPPGSYTLMLDSTINQVVVGNKGLTISEALSDAEAEIVIITLGVNGAADFTENQYKTYYKKLITAIKEATPNTVIILQSVFPVTKEYSDNNRITNSKINQINEWVKEIAYDMSVKYLDTQSILKDEKGAQIAEYGEDDGIHMNASAYRAILEYIRTHSIYE